MYSELFFLFYYTFTRLYLTIVQGSSPASIIKLWNSIATKVKPRHHFEWKHCEQTANGEAFRTHSSRFSLAVEIYLQDFCTFKQNSKQTTSHSIFFSNYPDDVILVLVLLDWCVTLHYWTECCIWQLQTCEISRKLSPKCCQSIFFCSFLFSCSKSQHLWCILLGKLLRLCEAKHTLPISTSFLEKGSVLPAWTLARKQVTNWKFSSCFIRNRYSGEKIKYKHLARYN